MVERELQRIDVGHDVRPRRFERVRARVGKTHMRLRVFWLGAQHVFEPATGADDGVAVEGVEVVFSLNKRAEGR